MKIYKLIIAALLAGVSAGCFWTAETNSNGAKTVNTSPSANENAPNAPNKTGNDSIKMEEVYPVKSYSQATPTKAMKTFIMATVNQDIPAIKEILSKSSLQLIENAAQKQNKSVGEILTAGAVENKSKKIPEFRNEKINGDSATVEYKDDTMTEFLSMALVKEDGKWKLALDVFNENLMKKLNEDMNKPAPKDSKK